MLKQIGNILRTWGEWATGVSLYTYIHSQEFFYNFKEIHVKMLINYYQASTQS